MALRARPESMASRTTIKRSWCPECAKKLSFEQVCSTTHLHGGKVLSIHRSSPAVLPYWNGSARAAIAGRTLPFVCGKDRGAPRAWLTVVGRSKI
jgi:hypothetical protein